MRRLRPWNQSLLLTVVKAVLILVPSVATTATITAAIRATSRPYSTAFVAFSRVAHCACLFATVLLGSWFIGSSRSLGVWLACSSAAHQTLGGGEAGLGRPAATFVRSGHLAVDGGERGVDLGTKG